MLADDTDIYFESSDLCYIQKVVNRELRKVRKWLDANRLALNIDNIAIFHSQRQRLTQRIVLKIGRKEMKEESYVKFLGIMLDSNLSWKFHSAELFKNLARNSGFILQDSALAPVDPLTLLYYGILVPFLSYGLSVWGLTCPSLLEPITVLQKKILIIMSFSETNAPSEPLFDRLQILKLNDMFQLQVTFVI